MKKIKESNPCHGQWKKRSVSGLNQPDDFEPGWSPLTCVVHPAATTVILLTGLVHLTFCSGFVSGSTWHVGYIRAATEPSDSSNRLLSEHRQSAGPDDDFAFLFLFFLFCYEMVQWTDSYVFPLPLGTSLRKRGIVWLFQGPTAKRSAPCLLTRWPLKNIWRTSSCAAMLPSETTNTSFAVYSSKHRHLKNKNTKASRSVDGKKRWTDIIIHIIISRERVLGHNTNLGKS
jgi:hypothetical protein